MNKFNLNDLRQDVADHLELDFIGLNPTQKFTLICYVTILNVESLIGSDYYDVMVRNPLTTIRFDFRGSHQVLTLSAQCEYHSRA